MQADVLPKLYPAVLWGVVGLQRLSLHHYVDFHLTDIPAALVPAIKVGWLAEGMGRCSHM
jgi:hypothetical protein